MDGAGDGKLNAVRQRGVRVRRLAEAMTWPPAEDLERLDAALQVRLAPPLAGLMASLARLKAILGGLGREGASRAVNEAAALPAVVPSAELDDFAPGDHLEVAGLDLPSEVPSGAATHALALLAGPALEDSLVQVEDAVNTLLADCRAYRFECRRDLVDLLTALPNEVLDRLEELAPGWEVQLAARGDELARLEHHLAGVGGMRDAAAIALRASHALYLPEAQRRALDTLAEALFDAALAEGVAALEVALPVAEARAAAADLADVRATLGRIAGYGRQTSLDAASTQAVAAAGRLAPRLEEMTAELEAACG
ncbi:MAG TPA: hypothetical protein VKU40_12865 [Thermoanaerobaculia bacterium]|nr:hypothetical protein [Thermoanaerobaculia bacterium]